MGIAFNIIEGVRKKHYYKKYYYNITKYIQCCDNNKKEDLTENTQNNNNTNNRKNYSEPISGIDMSSSERNLTNTQDQTIKKYPNENNIISFDSNDSINEVISDKIKIKLNEIKNKAPKLELIIVESLFLDENLKIKINSIGLESNSLRNKKDGCTYFGLLSPSDENINKKIDFNTGNSDIINTQNDPDIHYGLQFRIKFDLEEYSYFIKDYSFGNGYGTFMKVLTEIKIKDNTLINIGNNYIVFTFGVDELSPEENDTIDENQKILSVKVFRGELVNYSYVFNQAQINKILIGKDEKCNIVLNDDLLEDIHCIIEFKNKKGWYILDGYNNKNSENGTWICLSEETKIFEGMLIQSNQNIYKCHLID